jgi:hypothetical protein
MSMTKPSFRAACLAAAALLFALGRARGQDQPFHKYVALGDSITMGVQGACLVERHQTRTYAVILAEQLGIADFQLPLLGETRTVTNPARICLGAVVVGTNVSVGPVSQMTNPRNALLPRPYDNLGLDGARTADLVDLRTSDPTSSSRVQQAAALALRNFPGAPFAGRNAVEEANLLAPDLVTLWIGNNDVLGAMTSGVALEGVTLTPVAGPTGFRAKYAEVLTALRAPNRTLVVMNIPDVVSIPFATFLPPVVVNPATRLPVLVNGQPVPLLGSRAVGSCTTPPCPLPSGSLVILQALPFLQAGVGIPVALGGTGQPLADGSFTPPSTLTAGYVLYPDEVAAIRSRISELNAEITVAASANGAILVDTNALFNDISAHGYHVGGIDLSSAFLTGGLFSADGVHPNNIGHAVLADTIIQALNEERELEIERPNIAAALFEPDVPPTTPTSVDPSEVWKSLFGIFPPPEGIEIRVPEPSGAAKPVPKKGRRQF